ncbi:MAG: PASTA domain-containing protein [Flavobacteriaceae bacterium]|nr:PASTA domain-containing protein [Flavobacteriaceae bacterium]
MSIVKFIISKDFFKQVVLALIAIVVLCFLMLFWLKSYTKHGSFETVPELTGKSLDVAKIELKDNNLRMVVQDSANYNPKYPRFAVIEQQPLAGSQVKENRKIYLTLNPSGYRKISVPNVIRRTFRQARPALEALGFKIGKITYKDDIGKDKVLKVHYKGKTLMPGTLLEKTTKIDIVLGNGNRPSGS